ncbi:hypothetical protein SBOR_1720 [Sclerotinia borealis F-4128]|uniref:C2H2-type domain-containing protein n=1 Tax=Sclerotinia borealis (strain F-4128) TaxID=1432307 RepID=W9CTG4_SCLBF|nr:hypothetical protein SBOR_1720 [Sclerotinia borealis F-4128]
MYTPPPTREPASGPNHGPSFRPINPTIAHDARRAEVEAAFNLFAMPQNTTPTTHRPNTAPNIQLQPMHGIEDAITPITATIEAISSALANQRPLPFSPINVAAAVARTANALAPSLDRGNSTESKKTDGANDVDMDGSGDGSDNDDGSRPNKKKKVPKFFCVDFPPCNLSFTRSEHLARHIRKHTGERPFTCHCKRTFSRLDNLRQHASTVHQHQPIPEDSPAASSAKTSRQARGNQARPTQNRPRAATASGQLPTHRGHQRNSLSTSSIGLVSSGSIQPNVFRPCPPPLQDPIWGANKTLSWRPRSPEDYTTPNSATFSNGQNSPRWTSGYQSPSMRTYSRTASVYDGHDTPDRKLSTASAVNPFSSSSLASNNFGTPPIFSAPAPYSPGMVPSPSTPMAGTGHSWGDAIASNHADRERRRRTWGPDTAATITSRLQNVMTPNHYANGPVPQPSVILLSNAPPMEPIKLPGIESFDPIRRELSPPRRALSPMMADRPHSYHQPSTTMAGTSYHQPRPTQARDRPNSYHQPSTTMIEPPFYHQPSTTIAEPPSYHRPRPTQARDRPLSSHLDRQFNHLYIHGTSQGDASMWASETARAVDATAEQSQVNQPRVMFEPSTYSPRSGQSSSYHQHTASAPYGSPGFRRGGWHHEPAAYRQIHDNRVQGTSPEGSSSSDGAAPVTPQAATVTDDNPTILRSNGYTEETVRVNRPQQPIIHHYHTQSNGSEPFYTYGHPSSNQSMYQSQQTPKLSEQTYSNPLDALVAAATSDQVTVHKPY